MRKILVLQHIEIEDLGIIENFFKKSKSDVHYIKLHKNEKIPINLDQFKMMISLGGPMDTWMEEDYPWLIEEKKIIKKFVIELEKPFLGICLGCQLLGEIVGGTVIRSKNPEIGFYKIKLNKEAMVDDVFCNFPENFFVFQWHSYEVANLSNPNIKILGNSKSKAIQLFKYKNHAYGMQFHIEIDKNTIRKWSSNLDYLKTLKKRFGSNPIEKLELQQRYKLIEMRKLCEELIKKISTQDG